MNTWTDDSESNDDIKRLQDLLDEMVADLSEPKHQQESMRRDYKNSQFRDYHESHQAFTDARYLVNHCN